MKIGLFIPCFMNELYPNICKATYNLLKSQIAGILFGVAMGALFSVSLGTVGFALGASLANLGMVMFEGLDDPPDKK
jgi:hypothetical protein